MAAKKPTAEDQLAHMQTVLDGYKSQLAETTEDVESYRKQRDEITGMRDRWKKRAEDLQAEVGQLREELHGITVEKARLEGYIDRARQFDTEPEPVMVTVSEDMIRQPRNVNARDFESLVSYGSKDRPQPWYKRDV